MMRWVSTASVRCSTTLTVSPNSRWATRSTTCHGVVTPKAVRIDGIARILRIFLIWFDIRSAVNAVPAQPRRLALATKSRIDLRTNSEFVDLNRRPRAVASSTLRMLLSRSYSAIDETARISRVLNSEFGCTSKLICPPGAPNTRP